MELTAHSIPASAGTASETSPRLSSRFEQLLSRLCGLSVEDRSNIYQRFVWPDSLPSNAYWMSPSLTTLYGTPAWEELTETQRQTLSQRESIHFYSLNVHGERELLTEVISRIHTPGFEPFSEYLHHFVGEENEHMWYFSRFCQQYGGGLYPDKRVPVRKFEDPLAERFIVFARIEIFEELVDYFNSRMGEDASLPPIVCALNSAHHRDESRHVAFGRELVSGLHQNLRQTRSAELVQELEIYLKRYMSSILQSLYNPAVYRDAGLTQDAYALRRTLLAHPVRKQRHQDMLKRTLTAFVNEGIFQNSEVPV